MLQHGGWKVCRRLKHPNLFRAAVDIFSPGRIVARPLEPHKTVVWRTRSAAASGTTAGRPFQGNSCQEQTFPVVAGLQQFLAAGGLHRFDWGVAGLASGCAGDLPAPGIALVCSPCGTYSWIRDKCEAFMCFLKKRAPSFIAGQDLSLNGIGKQKDTIAVKVYTNCDEVELILNGKSLGKKSVDKNLYFSIWNLQFQPGNIKAIGYNNNKKVTEHILKTAGDAFQISAKPLKTKLKADGEDFALIEISILDKDGNFVFDVNNDVTVNISGEGELAGLDNGDTSYQAYSENKSKASWPVACIS